MTVLIDAKLPESGIADGAVTSTKILHGTFLTKEFTAGAAISADTVVALTADNEVQEADDTMRPDIAGVAIEAASSGGTVEVCIYGIRTLTADGAISLGDFVSGATTAGRVVSHAPSHGHTMPTHSHTALGSSGAATTVGEHQGLEDGAGGGTTLQVAVDTAGQTGATVATSLDDPGDTDTTSAVRGEMLGKALNAATGAGDPVDVLVMLF